MRILFDTDELRSLGSVYRSGAGAISNIRAATASSAAGLSLNFDDPVIRGARIHERQGRLNGQLDRLAHEYSRDADRFAALASELEGGQGELPRWLLTMPLWGALGTGAVGASFVAGGMVRTTGLTALERVTGGLRGLYGTFRVGAAVGRSAIDGALGLAGQAQDWLTSTAQRFADRLRQMAADAWNGIWNAVSERFGQLMAQIDDLAAGVSRALREGEHVLSQVSNWVATGQPMSWLDGSEVPLPSWLSGVVLGSQILLDPTYFIRNPDALPIVGYAAAQVIFMPETLDAWPQTIAIVSMTVLSVKFAPVGQIRAGGSMVSYYARARYHESINPGSTEARQARRDFEESLPGGIAGVALPFIPKLPFLGRHVGPGAKDLLEGIGRVDDVIHGALGVAEGFISGDER